jgi:hypothetical protein
MAEVFEEEDADIGGGSGIIEVCSSNEMGAPNASHLEQKTTQPNRPKQTKISPGKRACVQRKMTLYRLSRNGLVGRAKLGPPKDPVVASPQT